MIMAFAVRQEIIPRNPVKETSRMKTPKHTPKALTMEEITAIRIAARDWRPGEDVRGPRPDGQVRDLIEVMLGTATRIGETLALRKRDVDMAADPPRVHINGTIVVRRGGRAPTGASEDPRVGSGRRSARVRRRGDPQAAGTHRRRRVGTPLALHQEGHACSSPRRARRSRPTGALVAGALQFPIVLAVVLTLAAVAASLIERRIEPRLERARHSPPAGSGVLGGSVRVEAGLPQ
jgi:integrase